MNQLVNKLDQQGIRKFFKMASEYDDVLSLTIGEPDFPTPYHIREEAITSLQQGKTWYSPIEGIVALKEEISSYLNRRFNLSYNPHDEILVTVGASEAIDLIFRAHINPEDDVLVFAPSFVSYEPLAILTGANVIMVHTKREDAFKVTPQLLKEHVTLNTKAIILSYPNNPTGAIMSLEDYKLLVPILEAYQGIIVTDEIYAELTYDQEHASLAMIPSLKDKVVYINGFSKAYSMTGWRLGYVCAPATLLDPMIVIHQYSLMCAPTVSQFAGIEALKNGAEGIAMMKEQYALRQHYLVKRLSEMGLDPFPPQGAFYVFVDISSSGLSSDLFCEKLLLDQHVAIIPGTAFGLSGEGFVRISYSYSLDHLKIALDKIQQFLININH
jgi:aminotransferase